MNRIFFAQIGLVLALAIAWGIVNSHVVLSILYGGIACLLPNLIFAFWFFSKKHTRRPVQILLAFYSGELMKMLAGAAVIILTVKYLNAQILPAAAGYLVGSMAFWMAPYLLLKQQQQRTA